MKKISLCRLSVIVLTIVLSACTEMINISRSETREVERLDDRYQIVSTQRIQDPLRLDSTVADGSIYLVELKTNTDLAAIVRQREMAFLYYELRPCGDPKGASELYSAPAYLDAEATGIKTDGFYYYAAIPQNYRHEIDRYQAMRGKEKVPLPREICLGLGAGNMAGETLTTNFVPTQLSGNK